MDADDEVVSACTMPAAASNHHHFEHVMESMTQLLHCDAAAPHRSSDDMGDACVYPLNNCIEIRPPPKKKRCPLDDCGPIGRDSINLTYQQQVHLARIHPMTRYDNFYNAYNVDWHPAGSSSPCHCKNCDS